MNTDHTRSAAHVLVLRGPCPAAGKFARRRLLRAGMPVTGHTSEMFCDNPLGAIRGEITNIPAFPTTFLSKIVVALYCRRSFTYAGSIA